MLDVDLKVLGGSLRSAREDFGVNGLTVRELAMMTGVKESVIASYESGARQPSLRNLWPIVTALGIDLNELRRKTLVEVDQIDETVEDATAEEDSDLPPQGTR